MFRITIKNIKRNYGILWIKKRDWNGFVLAI